MNLKNVNVIICFVMIYVLAIASGKNFGTVVKRDLKLGNVKQLLPTKIIKNHGSCPADYDGAEIDAANHCYKVSWCSFNERYRRQDGSCNNQLHPTWGKSKTPFLRLTPNTWNDSISEPRKDNKLGSNPQNVRNCRVQLLPIRTNHHKKFSVNVMSFGQFGVHDISLSDTNDGTCCPIAKENPDECWSIDIPQRDEMFKDNEGCISLNRVRTTKEDGCKVQGGPQLKNRNTHIFDLDIILGRDLETSTQLRNVQNGSLLVQWIKNKHGHVGSYFLNSENPEQDCNGNHRNEDICFRTSDERVNQNPWLTVLHVIFLREFNRVVERLHEINPHWDGEKLYQEARQIVIAELQKIIAYDWLPIIIGETKTGECGLNKPKPGEQSRYDGSLRPGTTDLSNYIAMRVLHSIIPNFVCLDDSPPSNPENCDHKILLKDGFNRAGNIPDNFDGILHSLSFQRIKENDECIADAIGNRLFKDSSRQWGQDLRSIDMQRSIETGVGTYNDAREFCGLPRIESFQEFSKFGSEVVQILKECYNSPDDIDGIIGVTRLEDPLPDALVGPTSACIIAEQFKRWRFGDSWWYDGEKNKNRFTDKQIKEFQENVNLARIFCDNSNDLKKIQPNVFIVPGEGNKIVKCNSLPSLDLELWKDEGNFAAPLVEATSFLLNQVGDVVGTLIGGF